MPQLALDGPIARSMRSTPNVAATTISRPGTTALQAQPAPWWQVWDREMQESPQALPVEQ